ncbi:MAG: MmgE/PrpD family protein, partial [Rubrivivax sp.]|nr:MmgE/PrpD family protein [Rubrivivax sp.]
VPPEASASQTRRAGRAGAGIAGAGEGDGIAPLRQLLRQRGGTGQARSLVFGDRLPAIAAAQLGGTMCRRAGYCDAMAPGPHIGSALLPAALAAVEVARRLQRRAEAAGGAGSGLRGRRALNLDESQYDGFDPTGVAVGFASTAAACRVLGLDAKAAAQRAGPGLQPLWRQLPNNIDGTLAVRVIQGWVAATGIECAMATAGITRAGQLPHRRLRLSAPVRARPAGAGGPVVAGLGTGGGCCA